MDESLIVVNDVYFYNKEEEGKQDSGVCKRNDKIEITHNVNIQKKTK